MVLACAGIAVCGFAGWTKDALVLADAGLVALAAVGAVFVLWSVRRRFVLPVRGLTGLHDMADLIAAYGALQARTRDSEAALQAEIEANKLAQDHLDVAALIYSSSNEALVICDVGNKIIAVNPAFSRITGYSATEAVGRNPKFLSSGRQDSNFYGQMWRCLNETGSWQGEIWNRRKNGDIYAEWLNINAVRDASGAAVKYVASFSDITQRKRAEEELWLRANYDELTSLPNRRMFQDRLDHEIKKARRNDSGLALLFVDLDQFKDINDTLGHDLGDLLLVEAAHRLTSCVRDTDTVARLGGDEFTVIVVDLIDSGIIDRIAKDIIQTLSEPYTLRGEIVHSSASVGITLYPGDSEDIASLLKQADQAMYTAKAEGRNRYRYFTPAIQEAAHVRAQIIQDLYVAVDEGQFRVHFQPIINIASRRIEKAEVLVRWDHPRRGLIYPDHFIAVAEETGLINAIGDWVFKEATFQLKQWIDKTGQAIQISINASPVQFAKGIDTADWIAHLDRLGLDGSLVIIEITEGLFLHPTQMVINQLAVLRQAGLKVAIDDFGTGYSALSYLKHFDVDLIKIDQSFIRNLASDGNDLALSEAIIVMAHKLGYQVIAEGVETQIQLDLLTGVDCDQVQGYLFSRPVSAEAFETLLLKTNNLTLGN